MKRLFGPVAIAVFLLALASCGAPSPAVREGHKVGEKAHDFTLTDANGAPLRLSDYRGKVVVLDFWATWCPPCRKGIPDFVALQTKYADKGVVVIGVSLDNGWPQVRSFMGQYRINYPIAVDLRRDLPPLYGGVSGIPTTFIIDREGIIRTVHTGYKPAAVFTKAVEELL